MSPIKGITGFDYVESEIVLSRVYWILEERWAVDKRNRSTFDSVLGQPVHSDAVQSATIDQQLFLVMLNGLWIG